MAAHLSEKKHLIETLGQMGFEQLHITEALSTYENTYGNEYDMDIVIQVITMTQQKSDAKKKAAPPQKTEAIPSLLQSSRLLRSTVPKFVPHMTILEASRLQVNDLIDHRSEGGRFLRATIVEKFDNIVNVHYKGCDNTWDSCSDYTKEIRRFAKADSISQRPAHRFLDLEVGDYVDIKSLYSSQWHVAQIKRKDDCSGQVQVTYNANDKEFSQWVHLDDVESVAEAGSNSVQHLQAQVQLQSQTQTQTQTQLQNKAQVQIGALNESRASSAQVRQRTAYLSMEGKTVKITMKNLTLSELQDLVYERILKDKTWSDDVMLQISDHQNAVVRTDQNVVAAFTSTLSPCFKLQWVEYTSSYL